MCDGRLVRAGVAWRVGPGADRAPAGVERGVRARLDGGSRALAETADVVAGPGPAALRQLAAAVVAGRAGDLPDARHAAGTAQRLVAGVPAFVGWWHVATRWVLPDATTAGWGEPARWATEAGEWFTARGLTGPAAACRGLARRAGALQRRRGRGLSAVPPHLAARGVTSREVDVLTLVAEGLTNAEIAQRVYLSPRTVKGYVEQLLHKSGTTTRTRLAQELRRPEVDTRG